jgi:hypothetical protein
MGLPDSRYKGIHTHNKMEDPKIVTEVFPVGKVYSAYDKLIVVPKKISVDVGPHGYKIAASHDAVRNFRFGWVGTVNEITLSFNDRIVWRSGNLDKVSHVTINEFTVYNVIPLNIMTFTDVRVHVKGPCRTIFIDYEYVITKGHLVREAMSHLQLFHETSNGTLLYTGGCGQMCEDVPTQTVVKSGMAHSVVSDSIVRISVYHGAVNSLHRNSDILGLVESISPPSDLVIYTNPPCKDFWVRTENVTRFKDVVKSLIDCDTFNVDKVYIVDPDRTREMKQKHIDVIQRGIDHIRGNTSVPEEEIDPGFNFGNAEIKADHEEGKRLVTF